MSYGYVYKTTNVLNNKVYIGQHKGSFDKKYLGSGIVLKQAVKKHGYIHFRVDLVVHASNKKELDTLEKFYIAQAKKLLSEDLYNIAPGGYGCGGTQYHKDNCKCLGCRAKRHELLAEKHPMFGRHQSQGFIQRMTGDNNPAKRPEVKEKIGLAHRGDKNHMRRIEMRRSVTGSGNPMFGKKRPDQAVRIAEINKNNNPMHRPEVILKRMMQRNNKKGVMSHG